METSGVPARARATFGSPYVESKVKLGFRHLLEIVNEKLGEPVILVLRNIHHKKGKKNRNFVFERRLAKMAPSDEISIKKRASGLFYFFFVPNAGIEVFHPLCKTKGNMRGPKMSSWGWLF